jgi:hypothetical protein
LAPNTQNRNGDSQFGAQIISLLLLTFERRGWFYLAQESSLGIGCALLAFLSWNLRNSEVK